MLAPPLLWPSVKTPSLEVESVKDLNANLLGVAYNVEAWASALRLYQHAKHKPSGTSRDDCRRWKFLASNECVHELHHLKERLEKIKGYKLKACPSLAPFIASDGLRGATRCLEEYFPGIDQLRHAIAHSGANDVRPDEHAPEHGYLLIGFREPDRYSAHYKGVLRHLDITQGSLERIYEVTSRFFEAFQPAASALEHEGHIE